ncbi:phosphatase PAP2-related protein [Legionella nagasakiensis]|uniref:phosphatase PAP2-related protein n=1 Tax=Legionella nagasakiensis TaxID=535290 RepID=UPI001056C32C|nr:phosphatase PAP2-related protein [Legionella nagasakiensis]
MKVLVNRYVTLSQEAGFLRSLFIGFTLLIISFFIANNAGLYASEMAGNPVDDLILNYLPLCDVTVLHVYAALLFWLFVSIYMLTQPGLIPFITKTASVFIVTRSAFICLTHLGAPPNQLMIPEGFSSFFLFNGDLFFSGHVGGPFLLALLFWQNKILRYFSLAASVFFAYIVLVGHIHYSIDVFAAPFITFGIYELSKILFVKEYSFFVQEIKTQ